MTMQNQTARQVDREALVAKLRNHGIHKDAVYGLTFAEDLARKSMGTGNPEVTISEVTYAGACLRGDVEATCPKCAHEFTVEDAEIEGDIDIPEDLIEDAVEVDTGEGTSGDSMLTPEEVAFILHDWAVSNV